VVAKPLFCSILLTSPHSVLSFCLILISRPEHNATELAVLPALFAAGLARFHVRKPGWSAARVEAFVRAVPAQYHARLVLHGHPQLVRQCQLGGLHLTASQRAATPRRPTLRPGQSLSTSFHSLEEISRTRRRYDYVFLSPIFDSISKSGYASGFSLPTLQTQLPRTATRSNNHPQVLALGGITADNIGLLSPIDFAGAAVLGSIWQSADPVAAFQQVQAAISSWKHQL
jgi:thiamine-phosphate pyrophosphorylase